MDTLNERYNKIMDSLSPEANQLIVDLLHELELKNSIVKELKANLEAEKKNVDMLSERSKYFMDAYLGIVDRK